MSITITEALAEIKTINKRISKKREFVIQYLARQDGAKDPLEKEGGSVVALEKERQAIGDLEQRIVDLRRGIARVNDTTTITLSDKTRTISEWLTWRREVSPDAVKFLASINNGLKNLREQSRRQGVNVVGPGGTTEKPQDLVVNVNESALAAEAEKLQEILGQLDGQLSLKNATVPLPA